MKGQGLQNASRESLFLTSKFTIPQLEKETVEETCNRALKEIGTDYLDLYLLHYPDRTSDMKKILSEMATLIEKGKARSIGVSNCTVHHLQDILKWHIPISVNQVEFHPYLFQKELLKFCNQQSIHITSYRSLGKGKFSKDKILKEIAKKHGKTFAQISLKWLIDKKISVIPKASSEEHLKENLDLFDFSSH